MSEKKDIAIMILIGGKSKRFGTEKAIIEVLGKQLILHQIDTLTQFDNPIYLIAHSKEQIFKYKEEIRFPKGIKFIVDDREIFEFPKIYKPSLGVYSGFKELNDLGFDKTFLMSCDMPLIKPAVVELMIKESKGFEFCIPKWDNEFLEPFFSIYPVRKTYERARIVLKTQNYGIYKIIDKSWNTNYVSVENKIRPIDKNLLSLMNINAPIDIVKLMKYFQE